jgi:3-oxoacyl-[acyl-carrier-protein] synthase II
MHSGHYPVISDGKPAVVISGLGVISPIGSTLDEFWSSLTSRQSGISAAPELASEEYPQVCAGLAATFTGDIRDFPEIPDADRKLLRKSLKTMNRETQMALAAATHALADSRWAQTALDPERFGVCFGAGNVAMRPEDFLAGIDACRDESHALHLERWGELGVPEIAPLWLLTCLPNMPACQVAILANLRGPNNTITQGESATNLAIAEACRWIEDGDADAVLVGGTGNNVTPFSLMHRSAEVDIAPGGVDPSAVCRPFDRDRNGVVMAEGAAAFVLESAESAAARGAPIYGEVVGFGASCVISRAGIAGRKRSAAEALSAALQAAGIPPSAVGHLHAHGLSSRHVDRDEALAIRSVFATAADSLPIVAAKSYFGDSGAGSAALELAASLLALKHRRLFPILNCETLDPECPIRPVVDPDADAGTSFLNLNISCQGQASSVLIRSAA